MLTSGGANKKGGALFRCGNYAGAGLYFSKAVRATEEARGAALAGAAAPANAGWATAEFLGSLLSNRSAARVCDGDLDNALADAGACVAQRPGWTKGYGRRAAAFHALERYADAVAAAQEGLKLDGSHAALKKAVATARGASAASVKLDDFSSLEAAEKAARAEGGGGGEGGKADDDDPLGSFLADVEASEEKAKYVEKQRRVDDSCIKSAEEEMTRLLQRNHFWLNLNPYV